MVGFVGRAFSVFTALQALAMPEPTIFATLKKPTPEILYYCRLFGVASLTANVMQHALLQLVRAPKERALVYGLLATSALSYSAVVASSSSGLVAEPRRSINLGITTGVGLGWVFLAATTK